MENDKVIMFYNNDWDFDTTLYDITLLTKLNRIVFRSAITEDYRQRLEYQYRGFDDDGDYDGHKRWDGTMSWFDNHIDRLTNLAKLNTPKHKEILYEISCLKAEKKRQLLFKPENKVEYRFSYDDKDYHSIIKNFESKCRFPEIVDKMRLFKEQIDEYNAKNKKPRRTASGTITITPDKTDITISWNIYKSNEGKSFHKMVV
jgi:hypothetical protein